MSTACPYPLIVARGTVVDPDTVAHIAAPEVDGYESALCESATGSLAVDPLDATCDDCWSSADLPEETVAAALRVAGYDPAAVGEHGRRYLARLRAERTVT